MTDTDKFDESRKTNLTVNRKDMRDFKRLMLDWEEDNDFPIELKESHCLNAAMKLIIRASSPELINEYADQRNASEEDKKLLQESYKWFLSQYTEMLREVIETRIKSDKRRVARN